MTVESLTLNPAEVVPEADRAAIAALFDRMLHAWGQTEAYAACFWPEADYVAFDGVNQKGHRSICEAHRPLFEKWLKGSRLTGGITGMARLGEDVVLLHAAGSILLAGQSSPHPERASTQTLIAVRQGSEWRFRAFHNTRLRPMTQGAGSLLAWKLADLLWRWLGGPSA